MKEWLPNSSQHGSVRVLFEILGRSTEVEIDEYEVDFPVPTPLAP